MPTSPNNNPQVGKLQDQLLAVNRRHAIAQIIFHRKLNNRICTCQKLLSYLFSRPRIMKNILTTLLVIISLNVSAQIDSILGINAPKNVSKNYKRLAHHLCDSLDTDYQKANAIYNWVTHNIKYDVKSIHRSKLRTDKPNEVLKRGKTICGGYADLVTAMCKEVGIRAQTIIGYYKDWKFDEGDKFFIPNHAWNAVSIDNKWQYIDATAGAGYTTLQPNWFQRLRANINKKKLYTAKKPKFVKRYDSEPFLPNIESFRMRRLSADPLWQLCDTSLPLSIFESNEEKIAAFNLNHSKPQQFSLELSRINKLDWDEQVLECSKRTYDFNPRYTTMLARKKYVEAIYQIGDAIQTSNKQEGRMVLIEAKKELDKTKEIQLDQKKTIAKEVGLLKQKNKDKTAQFKKYRQELDKDNKAKNILWRTRTKQAQASINQWSKKQSKLKKKKLPNSFQTIAGIQTIKNELKPDAISLKTIEDSIRNRNKRILQTQSDYEKKKQRITNLQLANSKLIEEAADYYDATDSMLYIEMKARYEMHDDYDREVKTPQTKVKDLRFHKLNTTISTFLDSYDSLQTNMKANIKLLELQELNYKNNFKNIEQYKRKNSTNRNVLKFYSQQILEAQELRKEHINSLSSYSGKLQEYMKLFSVIRKAHNRELQYTKVMSLAEDKRNELEAKKIEKDSEWLKAANKKTKQLLSQTKKEADRLFKLRHSSNKKKWEKELKKLEARAKATD